MCALYAGTEGNVHQLLCSVSLLLTHYTRTVFSRGDWTMLVYTWCIGHLTHMLLVSECNFRNQDQVRSVVYTVELDLATVRTLYKILGTI